MIIEKAEFIKSVTRLEDLPEAGPPEIAFAGRSNVGKSSLLNAICRAPALARTSSTPGRTQALNYFSINDGEMNFVDLPGYGYAKVSQRERKQWGKLIEGYLEKRETLALVVLLVDARISLMESDRNAVVWLWQLGRNVVVALTKTDDVKQAVIAERKKSIHALVDDITIIATSAKNGSGIGELVKIISQTCSP